MPSCLASGVLSALFEILRDGLWIEENSAAAVDRVLHLDVGIRDIGQFATDMRNLPVNGIGSAATALARLTSWS